MNDRKITILFILTATLSFLGIVGFSILSAQAGADGGVSIGTSNVVCHSTESGSSYCGYTD